MAKKNTYFEPAEHYYVFQNMTLAEIATMIPVSERSLSDWKQEGQWDQKRAQHLNSKMAFHEELYELGRSVLRKVKEDIENDKKVSPTRLNFLTRITGSLAKAQEYEEAKAKLARKVQDGASNSDDLVAFIEKEILGIK